MYRYTTDKYGDQEFTFDNVEELQEQLRAIFGRKVELRERFGSGDVVDQDGEVIAEVIEE